jgi:hypothetical protein
MDYDRIVQITIEAMHGQPPDGYTDEEKAYREELLAWVETLPPGAIVDLPHSIEGLPD